MNPFQKNPFANKNTTTKIVGYNKQFDEKKKLEDIKGNMVKLKYQKPIIKEEPVKREQLNVNQKVNILKNIDRYK